MVFKKAGLALGSLVLAGCAASPSAVNPVGDTFEIRYDPILATPQEADEQAQQQCADGVEFIKTRTRWDTMKFRQYRCARK